MTVDPFSPGRVVRPVTIGVWTTDPADRRDARKPPCGRGGAGLRVACVRLWAGRRGGCGSVDAGSAARWCAGADRGRDGFGSVQVWLPRAFWRCRCYGPGVVDLEGWGSMRDVMGRVARVGFAGVLAVLMVGLVG